MHSLGQQAEERQTEPEILAFAEGLEKGICHGFEEFTI